MKLMLIHMCLIWKIKMRKTYLLMKYKYQPFRLKEGVYGMHKMQAVSNMEKEKEEEKERRKYNQYPKINEES